MSRHPPHPRPTPPTALLLTAALAALTALPAGPAIADDGGRLWLGDHDLGPAAPATPGPHRGADVQIGPTRWTPVWEADPAGAWAGRDGWEARPRLIATDTPAAFPAPALVGRRELVVVTTADLADRSELLPALLAFRRAEGWEVSLATEEDWDLPSGDADDSRAGRIRAFLADRYAADPGAFALLIGNPDPDRGALPMKWTRPLIDVVHYYPDWLAAEMDPIPSDFYYADLTGDWDCDGDGRYGEYPDDAGDGCVDFGPELFVGRLPIYGEGADGAAELDTLLRRLLDRDLETDKRYRADVLLPGALFGIAGAPAPASDQYTEHSDGAAILDGVYRALPEAFAAGATRLYEDAGVLQSPYPYDGPLTRDHVIDAWDEGRGIVLWAGHGSSMGVYRTVWVADPDGDGLASGDECDYPAFLESPDADDLAGAPGAFTFHISCDNGFPEESDNIGTALLYGGAVATATASRPAFGYTVGFGEPFEPRPDLATSSTAGYFYALGLADGRTAGEALAYTKYALPGDGWTEDDYGVDFTGAAWTTRVEYNLYGDPTRSLELCSLDADCDDGSPCNGTESCDDGFCVHHDPIDCSHLDGDCTIGLCDHDSGACSTAPREDGHSCDDGLWCTEVDACGDGVCAGIERDCGARDGYDAICDEAAAECRWEATELDDDGATSCVCRSAGDAGGPAWVAALAALFLWRRRSS